VIALPASGNSGLDTREQDIICTAIGAIVNKLPDGPLLNELVQQLLQEQMADPVAQQRLLAWVIKASIQRGLSIADKLFDDLLNALTESAADSRALAAASQFKIFFSDNQQLPLRKPLYKQKYFTKALNRLVPLFSNRETADAQRSVILTALGGLLKGLPQGALINSASTVVPLLLQALNSPDSSLRHETLTTFHLLMETDSSLVEQHLESLVPALLRISSDGTTSLPDTRHAALDCLLLFTKFPYHKIHPFKDRVVSGLKRALDDKKRQVRKAAVLCRNEWIVLTATPKPKK
jgi:DNA repair/transcription protein MET18/MMS19